MAYENFLSRLKYFWIILRHFLLLDHNFKNKQNVKNNFKMKCQLEPIAYR